MDFGHTYRADCSMRSFGHELRNPGLGFQSVIGYFHAFSVHCFSTRGAWFRRAVIKNTGTRKLPCFQRAREVYIHPPDSKRTYSISIGGTLSHRQQPLSEEPPGDHSLPQSSLYRASGADRSRSGCIQPDAYPKAQVELRGISWTPTDFFLETDLKIMGVHEWPGNCLALLRARKGPGKINLRPVFQGVIKPIFN